MDTAAPAQQQSMLRFRQIIKVCSMQTGKQYLHSCFCKILAKLWSRLDGKVCPRRPQRLHLTRTQSSTLCQQLQTLLTCAHVQLNIVTSLHIDRVCGSCEVDQFSVLFLLLWVFRVFHLPCSMMSDRTLQQTFQHQTMHYNSRQHSTAMSVPVWTQHKHHELLLAADIAPFMRTTALCH